MNPKYLDNSPLYSAVIEIRFLSQVPDDAVAGLLYSKLLNENESIQSTTLPAGQLPAAIRQQDPNLRFAPTQRFILPDQTLNVGSNVLSLEANNGAKEKTYPGWEVFFKQFQTLLRKLDFATSIERIGVRYINFYKEEDLLSELNVELKTGWESKGLENKSVIIFSVQKDQIRSRVTVSTDATIQDESGQRQGQLVDIDTYIESPMPLEDVAAKVDEAHKQTKDIFYSLPKKSLLKKMGPHDS